MSLIAIAAIFVVLAVVSAFAWRTIRFFIKLALVGALLLTLLTGVAWWRWPAGTSAPSRAGQRSAPARRNR